MSEILLPFRFENGFEFTGFRGLASHGAAIAIIIAVYFYSKKIVNKPMLWVLDRVVIPVSCGAIFVRIGNFFNSEIVGKVTDSSFGVKFVRDYYSARDIVNATGIDGVNQAYNALVSDPKYIGLLEKVPMKHPAQLYEAAGYVLVFAILFFLYWKTNTREKHGLLFGYFLVLLWTVRFLVEYVKESQGGFENSLGLFSTGQWLSIPFILIGIYFIFVAEKPVEVE